VCTLYYRYIPQRTIRPLVQTSRYTWEITTTGTAQKEDGTWKQDSNRYVVGVLYRCCAQLFFGRSTLRWRNTRIKTTDRRPLTSERTPICLHERSLHRYDVFPHFQPIHNLKTVYSIYFYMLHISCKNSIKNNSNKRTSQTENHFNQSTTTTENRR
jgi:hypothetical protein